MSGPLFYTPKHKGNGSPWHIIISNNMTYDFMILIISFIGMVSDIRTRKISNSVMLMEFISVIATEYFWMGKIRVFINVFGMMIPLILLIPAFLLRKIGAGDIKLIMIIELLCGPKLILDYLLHVFVFGIVIIVLGLVANKRTVPFAVAIFCGCCSKFVVKNIGICI